METTVFSRKIHWLSTIFFWRPLKYSPLVIYQDTNKRLSLFIDNSCTNNLSCDRMFIVLLKIKAKYIQKPNRYLSNTISTEPQYGVNFSLFLTLNIIFFSITMMFVIPFSKYDFFYLVFSKVKVKVERQV